MSANNTQVGGDHYKTRVEHWDFTVLNGLGYLEGCATKYISRWRKKAGKQDLEKALHYIDKLIELHAAGKVKPLGSRTLPVTVGDFARANQLEGREVLAIGFIALWQDAQDLLDAKECVNKLLLSTT